MVEAFLTDALKQRLLFFSGKGGVGKSVLAWATALCLRRKGKKVTLVSWNPFDAETKPLPTASLGIDWLQLETMACFQEYVLKALRFERIYSMVFDNHVLRTFVRVAPGLPDTVIAGKVWDLYESGTQDCLIVDLPSSGHAISFFESPIGVNKVFGKGFVHKESEKILRMFQSEDVRFNLVTLLEELPLQESQELKAKLSSLLSIKFGYVIANQVLPHFSPPKPMPAEPLASTWKTYEEECSAQTETLPAAKSLGMPLVSVPKIAAKGFVEMVKTVADHLEKQ